MIDLKNRVVFIHIPKTGGTSIESYFQSIRSIGNDELPALGIFINDKASKLERQNGHNTLEMYEKYYFGGKIPSTYRIFTVVRDPYSRFISELNYRRLPPPRRFPVHMRLPASLLIHLSKKPLPPLKDLNSHTRPQVTFIQGESTDRVRILRFENLQEEFEQLQKDWDLPVLPLLYKNVSKKRKFRDIAKLHNFVTTFYADDFKHFGYNKV